MEFRAHHICLTVADPESSRAFYEKALGFTETSVVYHTPEIVSHFLTSQDGTFHLQLLHSPHCKAEHCAYGHLGMTVADIYESFAYHEKMGVVSKPIITQPHQYGYFIQDPDGYETELCQLRTETN